MATMTDIVAEYHGRVDQPEATPEPSPPPRKLTAAEIKSKRAVLREEIDQAQSKYDAQIGDATERARRADVRVGLLLAQLATARSERAEASQLVDSIRHVRDKAVSRARYYAARLVTDELKAAHRELELRENELLEGKPTPQRLRVIQAVRAAMAEITELAHSANPDIEGELRAIRDREQRRIKGEAI